MEVHGIVGELLAKRGFSGEALEAFLDPSLKRLADASRLPGLRDAVDFIIPFVRDKRKIVVFGDYDCDGVCASAILALTFRRLGADAAVFIPDRFTEGYGMTPASVARMLKENPDAALVITVDCGITSAAEVKSLKDRGIAVVVTDHHMPSVELPDCDALVDPKLPSQREEAKALGAENLCGAGIAFYLANVLATRAAETGIYDGAKFAGPLLVLAGLATVVDIMPLLGQNRILVANALKTFRAAPVGLTELLLRAQRRPVDLTSRDFGFLLGPRINAAGRMVSALEAFDLIVETDRERARELALRVDTRNVGRKAAENRMVDEVLSRIGDGTASAIVVNGESGGGSKWHSGVCGIVASRILERFGVPVAIAVDGHGSVRAPEGYDVHAALTACSHLLERFGGHKAAGGFTVRHGMFEEFGEAFRTVCAKQSEGIPAPREEGTVREPEMWISPNDLTMELHESVSVMEPFGEGNPEPVFGIRGVVFSDVRPMGENGKHAAIAFAGKHMPRATWWNHGSESEKIRAKSSSRFDITFTLDVSDWGGEEPHLELRIRDVGISAVAG